MNLKKLERYLPVNLLGPGPRLLEKECTGPRSDTGWDTPACNVQQAETILSRIAPIPALGTHTAGMGVNLTASSSEEFNNACTAVCFCWRGSELISRELFLPHLFQLHCSVIVSLHVIRDTDSMVKWMGPCLGKARLKPIAATERAQLRPFIS